MDLSIKYLGYQLKNPIIIGSSGLTNSVEKIKKLEANNAGAVVLKSLFEEQIESGGTQNNADHLYSEAYDYIQEYSKSYDTDKFLHLIEESRKAVSIPVIASINAGKDGSWVEFAKKMEAAGAHAIELNISILPFDAKLSAKDISKTHLSILKKVRNKVSIPIGVKISSYSSELANLVQKIAWSKNADYIAMFNRFYNPDIDIKNMKLSVSNVFSSPKDSMPSLRWIAMLAEKYPIDFVGTTGIYTADDIIKQLLVGASAVQIVSAVYKNGSSYINTLLADLKKWMAEKGFSNIDDFKGKMSMGNLEQPNVYERVQFMKYYGTIE